MPGHPLSLVAFTTAIRAKEVISPPRLSPFHLSLASLTLSRPHRGSVDICVWCSYLVDASTRTTMEKISSNCQAHQNYDGEDKFMIIIFHFALHSITTECLKSRTSLLFYSSDFKI
ncbi:hypothetical protein OPV22_027646 [Ensete ventricosum]|uniref:Uncharacterized protein n=1 Tax=Ensete ventricosum TaxID=4639 RepID=A0AAV8Q175_ENSVE|nr:hypothetical protein OPV22_027646 [Ensete ventricosum]